MKGNQIPRIRIEPPRTGTDGQGAAMLMQEYGYTLDPWQQLILDSILGTDKAGEYTTTSAGISVPRQNGKSELLIARIFYGLLINGERIIYSAHQMRSVKRIFFRLEAMFTDKRKPEVSNSVARIRYGIGEEGISLKNGGCVEFMSRSRQTARGFDGISLIIFDEAAEVTEEQAEALIAVLSASKTGTRQIIYAGTPPYIGCTGEVFRRFRQACIAADGRGEETRNSWHEWSIAADNLQEIDLSDKRLWYDTNPALGFRLSVEFTEQEYKALSPEGFARERLGFWAAPASEKAVLAIDADLWDSCASDEERPEGKTAYAVKFVPDGSEVCLCGAVIPTGQPARITLLALEPTGNGLAWLAEWLNQRNKEACCVVIDGRGGADALVEKLKDTWIYKNSIIRPKATDVTAAAGMLINDLRERNVTWYRQQETLRESAITATKRSISGGFGFGGATCAPIEACSLALWGCRQSKRNPAKKMLIG